MFSSQQQACDALGVIVLNPSIHNYLKANDPKALEQARAAFLAVGGEIPEDYDADALLARQAEIDRRYGGLRNLASGD